MNNINLYRSNTHATLLGNAAIRINETHNSQYKLNRMKNVNNNVTCPCILHLILPQVIIFKYQ